MDDKNTTKDTKHPYEQALLRLWAEGIDKNNPGSVRVAALASLAAELRESGLVDAVQLRYELKLPDPSEAK